LLAVLFVVRGKWRSVDGRHGVVAAGFSALLALGIAHMVAELWARPRPYVAHPDAILFIAPSSDSSFPSDHATAAFAIAVAILLRDRRWGAVALAFACVLAVGRVAMGVHYPSDVLGGLIIGSAWVVLCTTAIRIVDSSEATRERVTLQRVSGER
jgi:undecaprenyl-diphosphatase